MNWLSVAGKAVGGFIGKIFVGDKGIVEQISDVTDKWMPSKTTIHRQSIEDLKAGDNSQDSARKMVLIYHDSWLDIAVDAWARLPRPLFATWAFGLLVGWWEQPEHINQLNPVLLNIIWTVVTFYFGARVIVKDIPAAVALTMNAVQKYKDSKE